MPDELDQLLALTREADRVELKLTVPGHAHDVTCAALGVDFANVPARRCTTSTLRTGCFSIMAW